MKRLCLIDVSAMYFRAFYAIRPLTNSKGLPTNALFGFLSMTGKMLRDLKPDYIAYCFDQKDGSFRNEMYEEYKANRSEMPEELKPQVPYIKKLTEALNIKAISVSNYEADDLIGMLAKKGADEGFEVMIVSGDKDFAQLVDDKIKMFDPMKEVLYDKEKVVEKWGVEPNQIIDYLSIVGDSSDNVPGVKGVGPKGAVKLLTEYKTLEAIYENIEEVGPKGTKAKLIDFKDNAFLSKDLVTIITENKTEISDIEELKWEGFDAATLEGLMQELEFKNMGKRLIKDASYLGKEFSASEDTEEKQEAKSFSDSDLNKIAVNEFSKLDELRKALKKEEYFFFLCGSSVCFATGETLFSVPADLLENEKIQLDGLSLRGHDLKSLWRSFHIQNATAKSDTLIAEYLLVSKSIGSFESLVEKYHPGAEFQNDVRAYYLYLKELTESLEKKLKEVDCLEDYLEVELPCLEVLHKMESRGICLDKEMLSEQEVALQEEADRIQKEVFEHCEQEFNLDSPKQLGKVLFDDLGLPVVKKTKTGYSTNSEVLQKLTKKAPWVEKIITYRELKKLLSTYVKALPELTEEDGRIHTHFNQAVTATGRLSSTEPNLQNIPIRTPQGNAVREAFVSPDGFQIVSADYSQIELRLLAHITEDDGLCKAFAEDRDIHTATAAEVFEVDFDKVDPEMRRQAKAVNFGIAYGMGAFSLAENLGIGRKEAKDIIERYFNRFKNVKDYMGEIVESAKEQGYVESIFGRRRYIPELSSSNAILRKNGERIAINSPMQASASDIVKKAMVAVEAKIPEAKMLLQVHDELIFEIADEKVEESMKVIRQLMEEVVELRVPLKVNIASGKNWKEAH
ncbi:MAG: DNA polymerase I [Bdellovibrionota bacterium]|nr:DNA polymerase I [Bdellovibrionota bacterium]